MARTLDLLLTENVDNLGIVGDVVKVRTGYARNFLLPRALATTPSEEMIKSLAAKRAEAERQLAELRKAREATIGKLTGFELQLIRSCNDMGILYGAVTQQDIAKALSEKGHDIRARDVRLPHAIKRVDTYEVHIKFEADLEAVVKLWVMPDRKIEDEKKPDLDFDREGNLVSGKGGGRDGEAKARRTDPTADALAAVANEKPAKAAKAAKSEKSEKPTEPKAEKPAEKKGEKKAKKSKE